MSSLDRILPFLRPIVDLLLDPAITEVMVNEGGRRVFVERDGALEGVPDRTLETRNLTVAIKNIARACGDEISEMQPLLDARLEDGSRVAAMLPPCAVTGAVLTIRKFTRRYTVEELVGVGALTPAIAAALTAAVATQQNILISGGTGTGKTTLLNALAAHVPDHDRLVVIEETAEIHLDKPNVLRLEARRAQVPLGQDAPWPPVTIADLLRAALRHRPDRILVGEVRGAEAWLRFRNAARWNVYVSVNAVAPGRSRTREAIAAIRHVVLDVDRDGPRVLADLAVRRDLPTPSYVLHTSSARVHLLWRVQGFGAERVEALQRRLARQLGADAAATSCAQMTRLPGFVNYKYACPHLVTVDERAAASVYAPTHFPRPPAVPSLDAPSIRLVSAPVPVIRDPLARARRFLARAPPAIAGQHGDVRTFQICCRLIRGFGLSDDEALAVLGDWNARCRPPWSDADLLGKVSHARRYGREPVGGLLTGHARDRDRIERTGWS